LRFGKNHKHLLVIHRVIDAEQPKESMRRRKDAEDITTFDWTTSYWTYAEINTWMNGIVAAHESASLFTVGDSFEGRAINGVKINIGGGSKPAVFLEGTMHAREWISAATTTWIINELLTTTDPAVQEIANAFEWYAIPVTNPDGYSFTHTNTRLWRKTRRPTSILCTGTDANRNWGFQWMTGGASTNACSDTFGGPNAFSEPEVDNLAKYLLTLGDNLVAYFSYHAYGQMMMTPYGYTTALLGNYQQLMRIGQKGVDAISALYGTPYELGSIANVICEFKKLW